MNKSNMIQCRITHSIVYFRNSQNQFRDELIIHWLLSWWTFWLILSKLSVWFGSFWKYLSSSIYLFHIIFHIVIGSIIMTVCSRFRLFNWTWNFSVRFSEYREKRNFYIFINFLGHYPCWLIQHGNMNHNSCRFWPDFEIMNCVMFVPKQEQEFMNDNNHWKIQNCLSEPLNQSERNNAISLYNTSLFLVKSIKIYFSKK